MTVSKDNYEKIQIVGVLPNGVKHIHEINLTGVDSGRSFLEEGISISEDHNEVNYSDQYFTIRHRFKIEWSEIEVVGPKEHFDGLLRRNILMGCYL